MYFKTWINARRNIYMIPIKRIKKKKKKSRFFQIRNKYNEKKKIKIIKKYVIKFTYQLDV